MKFRVLCMCTQSGRKRSMSKTQGTCSTSGVIVQTQRSFECFYTLHVSTVFLLQRSTASKKATFSWTYCSGVPRFTNDDDLVNIRCFACSFFQVVGVRGNSKLLFVQLPFQKALVFNYVNLASKLSSSYKFFPMNSGEFNWMWLESGKNKCIKSAFDPRS